MSALTAVEWADLVLVRDAHREHAETAGDRRRARAIDRDMRVTFDAALRAAHDIQVG